ncbi:MAG: cbb3-type cytochrome oxidase assembly protein CcoS [Gallionella sp.]|nr:cbb3-type cytochrome oxidase assembly protein CcoS [Gallionella sp.]
MDVIYSLIPGMMFFGLIFLVVLIWAVKKGQYEDMEGNANRILLDDNEDMMDRPDETTSHSTRLSKNDNQVAGYDDAKSSKADNKKPEPQ